MVIDSGMVMSGFVSKVMNDCGDILKNKLKIADKNRKTHDQSIETRIYQLIIDAINVFTNSEHKGDDILYDVAECILKGFKSGKEYGKAVKKGLEMFDLQVTDDRCKDFLEKLCHMICRTENSDLYKEIDMIQENQMLGCMQEGFKKSSENDEEINRKLDVVVKKLDNQEIDRIGDCNRIHLKNRAEEYEKKWNKNVFLNDFGEEDEKAGVEVKLADIYKEECLPHYKWKTNEESSDKLRGLLKKYIIDKNEKEMLLILGQPGIGKSTLITWIMANLVEKKDDILVFQFANDLGSINWQGENVLNDIFKIIGLEYDELENKTLILDGFDEVYVSGDRERILNKLYQELKRGNILEKFSLIITCRQNYIYGLQKIKCDYITLRMWNETQIEIFCRAYWEKCEDAISEDKIQKILKNKKIFGIPLILYMILALDIKIEKSSSIVDVYDQIFSLKKGGIYDRDYDIEHRINDPEIKKYVHQTSQKIAFWIFENNNYKAFIYQKNFKEICDTVVSEAKDKSEEIQSDTLIGSYLKIKYCEGMGTDEVCFVHRSIYEYFAVIYFFESIHKLRSREEVTGKLGELLKQGHLTEQMLEFIKYKFDSMKGYNLANITKKIFNKMLRHGMTYCTKVEESYNNVIERERNIFSNMLEVVHLWNSSLRKLDKRIIIYLQCNRKKQLNLSGIQLGVKNDDMERADLRRAYLSEAYLSGAYLRGADLSGADLVGADLSGAYLRRADLSGTNLSGAELSEAVLVGADLSGACLRRADLVGADLRRADLSGADLSGAYLRGADLREVDLRRADLIETTFSEKQVNILYEEYDLSRSKVVLSEAYEIISYQEYCSRKQKD